MEFPKLNSTLIFFILLVLILICLFIDIIIKNNPEIYINTLNMSDITRLYKLARSFHTAVYNKTQ